MNERPEVFLGFCQDYANTPLGGNKVQLALLIVIHDQEMNGPHRA
jgi:hypothetical protein